MKIDEYRLATIYTSSAMAVGALYAVVDSDQTVPENSQTRDMIWGFLYASILGILVSYFKDLKRRGIVSVASSALWLGRFLSGILVSQISDVYRGEEHSLAYWGITAVGLVSSITSAVLQIIRIRKQKRQLREEISPVKLRFVTSDHTPLESAI